MECGLVREAGPGLNTSSGDKGVATQSRVGPQFPPLHHEGSGHPKAPVSADKAGPGCQLAASPTDYELWYPGNSCPHKTDKLANN